MIDLPAQARELSHGGALFAVSHSGGKDSQAMTLAVRSVVPDRQILIVHAPLGEVEWPDLVDHIRATAPGLPLVMAPARKSFFDMVATRGRWPSPAIRQCTSDLKRGPIEREIRRHLAAHPEFEGRVVSCVGLRAEESTGRAKAAPFKMNERNSRAGRAWFDWLPIQDWSTARVFAAIAAAGQAPHWAYAKGMSRLSCCFCIMASRADLRVAATMMPELYARYVEAERRMGQSFVMPGGDGRRRFLEEITGIPANRRTRRAA